MNYVLGVSHPVEDLAGAARMLSEGFGFSLAEQGRSYRVLENGALTIRLVASQEEHGWLGLDAASEDLAASRAAFRQQGFLDEGESRWASSTREEVSLRGPHHLLLTLYREYNEDELGVVPELPTSMPWDEEADRVVRELLRSVPVTFRDSARQRVVRAAETDALVVGLTCVERDAAITSLVTATPDFQHAMLRETLTSLGLRWQDYFPAP